MNLKKMNRDIRKLDEQVEEILARRNELAEKRDREMAAQTQKNFAKTKIPPERLMLLIYAKGDQLEKLIHDIEMEQGLQEEDDPAGPEDGQEQAAGDWKEENRTGYGEGQESSTGYGEGQENSTEDGKEQENGTGEETVD